MEQRKFQMPTAYTILFCLILLVACPHGSSRQAAMTTPMVSPSPAAITPSPLRRRASVRH